MSHKPLPLPSIGLGTYHIDDEKAVDIFKMAYQLGYRHFDTATFYQNEHFLGEALKEFERSSYCITSKLWTDQMSYYGALRAFDRSLNELQTSYLDYYLIHWPHPRSRIVECLQAIHELKGQKRLRYYGVSNFTIAHLEDAKNEGFEVAVNQVEYHPYLNQEKLLHYCQQNQIQLIAYCPLARTQVFSDPTLLKIARKYSKKVPQVILKWLLQKGIYVIPKAASFIHQKENLDLFDFKLETKEMSEINSIQLAKRIVTPDCGDFDYDKKNTLK